jgi:hypothetical protein
MDQRWTAAVAIPPGHACYIEPFSAIKFDVHTVVHLDRPDEVARLRALAEPFGPLASALDRHLDDFRRLFVGGDWLRVYDGPFVVVSYGSGRLVAYELLFLLQIAGQYAALSRFPGASLLGAGLQNPPQIPATLFEIETAAWCSARAVTQHMEFSPDVTRADGRVTRPEFHWHTSLGSLYCECKRSPDFEDTFRDRARAIERWLEARMLRSAFPAVRFDFWIDRTGGAEQSIERLIDAAVSSGAEPGFTKTDRAVTLAIAPRGSDLDSPGPGHYRTSSVPTSTRSTALGASAAAWTVQINAHGYWRTVAHRLIRDARTQVPTTSPSAIMIGLPMATATEAASSKVQQLIEQPAYANTPWIGVWAQGGLRAWWRNGQPFDARLGE